jgi:hypothetical protein
LADRRFSKEDKDVVEDGLMGKQEGEEEGEGEVVALKSRCFALSWGHHLGRPSHSMALWGKKERQGWFEEIPVITNP